MSHTQSTVTRTRAAFAALWLCASVWSSSVAALSAADRQHLLVRTGFGVDPKLAIELKTLNREAAVEALLATLDFDPTIPPPRWTAEPLPPQVPADDLNPEQLAEFKRLRNKTKRQHGKELQAWYLRNAAASRSAFAERITLFWHNVFTVELRSLPHPLYLWQQQQLIRAHGSGDYRQLVRQMSLNPAMLVYLDNHKNHRKRPNENYARELLELHTLGEGHFSEQDVRELGRTLTGARPNLQTAKYAFKANWHDDGDKTVFNRTGAFSPEDAAELVLQHPRAARYPVERLWRAFVSESLDRAAIDRLSTEFVDNRWQIKPLLRALLLEDAFWAEENRQQLVRAPIELVIGLHQETDLTLNKADQWVKALANLGQDLFNPPDVAGWPGGLDWINTSSLIQRQSVIEKVAQAAEADAQTNARWLDMSYQLK